METTLLIPAEFEVLNASVSKENIKLSLLFCSPIGYCPLCHTISRHVHSHYQRKVRDFPISGKEVELQICCRKFFCEQKDCPRKIFAQQCESCLKPYARCLERATAQVLSIGLSMGGRPGARVCQLTGLPFSASTILRILRRIPAPEINTPTVLGVDDFAFRKGNSYGTILIDLEKRKPVDLLPDREGKTLENWLLAHPGVAIFSRDRSSIYANAIRNICPEAIQVADRWHLLKNLGENSAKYLDTQRTFIKETAREFFSPPPIEKDSAELITGNCMKIEPKGLTEKRYATFEQVKELQGKGYSARAIARHLRISRTTTSKYFQQEAFIPRVNRQQSNLLDYESYLRERWLEGQQCVKTLLKEIKAKGYNGAYTILAGLLTDYPRTPDPSKLPPAKKAMSFSSRSLSIILCQQEIDWGDKNKPFFQKLLEKSSQL
jgi:transposase